MSWTPTGLSYEERERRAYIAGHANGAALLGELADFELLQDEIDNHGVTVEETVKLREEAERNAEAIEAAGVTLDNLCEALEFLLLDEEAKLGKRSRAALASVIHDVRIGKVPSEVIAHRIAASVPVRSEA